MTTTKTAFSRVWLLALGALVGAPGLARADGKAPAPAPATPTPASPVAPKRALVVHVPPIVAAPDQPIELEAMLDTPFAEEKLEVRWRRVGETAWHDAAFERSSAGGWFVSLPGANTGGVEYYISGRDAAGHEVLHFASPQAPHVVRIDPTLIDRLEALDRDRLENHRDRFSLDVVGHNFGNRYGIPDRFVRAEAAYTHRLWRILYEVTFGFGSVSGKTPTGQMPDSDYVARSLRYGFGGIRLRPHRAVFVDARASLGVSQDGFDQGLRGQVTFGRPWRSCVQVGGETLGDVGKAGWVRLQWDTAPPLLMGASVVRSDLPGALVDPSGLYVVYDVSYKLADTFTVKAQLSYGARDGAASFGGGLGTAVEF